ncbi:MAG: FMN-dependent NADH-azoreductase [Gammaproteobacteria bacterium]|jgi:FMN-dependent NADH-azoreductase|tara:strand:+ start:1443 stop:2027 length:585 start_codon:yes stop_codon:yes gene_type:complete
MSQQILRIDASMRKNGSYSRALGDRLIAQLKSQSLSTVKVRDLADGIPNIDETWIGANFTDIAERTAEQRSVLSCSDALISELKSADTLVIGLPIYNFNVPAAFKAWIDQIARANITFRYGDNGPEGLLKDKKSYVILSSGGTQLGSNIDYVTEYMHHILGFIGIKDVTIIDSSGIGRNESKVIADAHSVIDGI